MGTQKKYFYSFETLETHLCTVEKVCVLIACQFCLICFLIFFCCYKLLLIRHISRVSTFQMKFHNCQAKQFCVFLCDIPYILKQLQTLDFLRIIYRLIQMEKNITKDGALFILFHFKQCCCKVFDLNENKNTCDTRNHTIGYVLNKYLTYQKLPFFFISFVNKNYMGTKPNTKISF